MACGETRRWSHRHRPLLTLYWAPSAKRDFKIGKLSSMVSAIFQCVHVTATGTLAAGNAFVNVYMGRARSVVASCKSLFKSQENLWKMWKTIRAKPEDYSLNSILSESDRIGIQTVILWGAFSFEMRAPDYMKMTKMNSVGPRAIWRLDAKPESKRHTCVKPNKWTWYSRKTQQVDLLGAAV